MSASDESPPRDEVRSSPPVVTQTSGGLQVLRLTPSFAALAILAAILGRAVGPSMEGLAVGLGKVIAIVQVTGNVLSQTLAVAAIVLAMAEILVVSRSRVPAPVRLGSIALGGSVVLVCFLASPRRESLPDVLVVLMSVSAIVFAWLAGATALKAPFARAAGLVIGLVAVSSLLHLIAVALAVQAKTSRSAGLVGVVATAGFLAGFFAIAIAAAWIASRSRKLASMGTLVPLALALLFTQKALQTDNDDAGAMSLLLRRAVDHLVVRPLPIVPPGFQIFVAVLAPLLAVAALFSRPARGASAAALSPPSIGAAIALALVVRDAPDMPLGALALVIAALTATLAAHDTRSVWDVIAPRNRS